jgi:hypothetical protein
MIPNFSYNEILEVIEAAKYLGIELTDAEIGTDRCNTWAAAVSAAEFAWANKLAHKNLVRKASKLA